MRSLTTWVMVILTLLGFLAITVLMDVPSAMALLPLLFAAAGVLWIWRLARVMERRQARQLQAQQVAAAVAAERLTIARDLHDLVSHGLGLITVRAAVARSVDATSPDRLMAALGDIEQASRATTLELRRMLQVLRASQSPPLSPAPGAPNWQESITAAERAGLTVEAAETSVAVNSNGVALAVHRILQEGLANVTRHAGPTKVRIDLTRNGDTLCLTMADEGPVPGWRARPGAGHGLLGLQERVAALGGELSHSSSPAGFRLVAELPDPEPTDA